MGNTQNRDTLLAFKPFLYNTRLHSLHPYTLPDYFWPSLRVVTSPCPVHQNPAQGCTCGVHSTFDLEAVQNFMDCEWDPKISELAPMMGIIQVLGEMVVEDMTIRSWGAFLWGLVKPKEVDWDYFTSSIRTYLRERRMNPVMYHDLWHAWRDIQPTLVYYKLTENNDAPY